MLTHLEKKAKLINITITVMMSHYLQRKANSDYWPLDWEGHNIVNYTVTTHTYAFVRVCWTLGRSEKHDRCLALNERLFRVSENVGTCMSGR